jgi:hypothetical protein
MNWNRSTNLGGPSCGAAAGSHCRDVGAAMSHCRDVVGAAMGRCGVGGAAGNHCREDLGAAMGCCGFGAAAMGRRGVWIFRGLGPCRDSDPCLGLTCHGRNGHVTIGIDMGSSRSPSRRRLGVGAAICACRSGLGRVLSSGLGGGRVEIARSWRRQG